MRLLASMFVGLFFVAACSSKDDRPAAAVGGYGTNGSGASSDGGTGAEAGDAGAGGDEMVLVTGTGGLTDYYVDSFEAAVVGAKAQSLQGVAPTVNIDFAGAKAACVAAGKRLCTHKEWRAACRGPQDLLFGFQADDTNLVATCDVARTTNNTPGSLPSKTYSHPSCKTQGYDVWDMIGNLTEWATDDADGSALASGAAFYQTTTGSNCDATLNIPGTTGPMPPTEKATDIGFRCCRSK